MPLHMRVCFPSPYIPLAAEDEFREIVKPRPPSACMTRAANGAFRAQRRAAVTDGPRNAPHSFLSSLGSKNSRPAHLRTLDVVKRR